MKHYITYILLLIFVVAFPSCDKETLPIEKLGKVSYYDSFLFWSADTTSLTKTISFEFNNDAVARGKTAEAEFAFVDVNGNPVSVKELRIERNGKVLPNNRFKVDASNPDVELTFTYLPAAKSGTHQGRLQLVGSSNLDRVCSCDLSETGNPALFKWDIKFVKKMNPLKFWMIVVFGAIFLGIVVWQFLLKKIFFPTIRLSRIQLTSDSDSYFADKAIKGYRRVIMTENAPKQSWLSKKFVGEILYIKSHLGVWNEEWELSPHGKTLSLDMHQRYMIKPVVSELESLHDYTMTQISTKKTIKIKII